MNAVFKWVLDHWAFVAFLISIVIQFTPAIKWNPFTSLFGWIGKLANGTTGMFPSACCTTDLRGYSLGQELAGGNRCCPPSLCIKCWKGIKRFAKSCCTSDVCASCLPVSVRIIFLIVLCSVCSLLFPFYFIMAVFFLHSFLFFY